MRRGKCSDIIYIKSLASKYPTLEEAARSEGTRLLSLLIIRNYRGEINKIYPNQKTPWLKNRLCIAFSNKQEVYEYLSKNAYKYKSLTNGANQDPFIQSAASLMFKNKLDKERVYSYFGGKQEAFLFNEFDKQEMINYLSLVCKKYASINQFLSQDIKGNILRSHLKHKSISTSFICKKFNWSRTKSVLREKECTNNLVKMLDSLKNVKEIEKEFCLDKTSRVDLKITLKSGKVYLIEIKHDESKWSLFKIEKQICRYSQLGKQINNFERVILCSPTGRYGKSFNQVLRTLSIS